jgi:DNA-binding response OmpR family regulator
MLTNATRKSALEVGCVDYLEKPFAAKSLINANQKASI